MLKYMWEFRGHSLQQCSLAALSLTDNCKFLLLKAKVSLLSEYILLKASILSLDNLRSKKKLRGREQEEGTRVRKVKLEKGRGMRMHKE